MGASDLTGCAADLAARGGAWRSQQLCEIIADSRRKDSTGLLEVGLGLRDRAEAGVVGELGAAEQHMAIA